MKKYRKSSPPCCGWTIMICLLVFIGGVTSQAAAQQRPGMPFLADTACQAPILLEILTDQIPPVIPQSLTMPDPAGQITSYQPNGPTKTASNAFFSSQITKNKRTCFTCHQPQNDWEISPPQILAEYVTSMGRGVLFHPIDAAVCPNAWGANADPLSPSFLMARSMLFTLGDFRIGLNAPNPLGVGKPGYTTFDGNTTPEWVLTVDYDPYGCEMDPTYGLPNNQISVYRRPLNSCNVTFLVQDPGFYQNTAPIAPEERQDIMWDAREPDLKSQFIDATEFHGQTKTAPNTADISQGILFQSGLFAAQTYNNVAGDLTGADGSGALGGPVYLYDSIPSRAGFNFILQQNTACIDFTPAIQPFPGFGLSAPAPGAFDQLVCPGDPAIGIPVTALFTAFANPPAGNPMQIAMRESIARGEALFNGGAALTINNVPGLNDVIGANPVPGACSTCHNNNNVANDAFGDPKRLGIMDNSNNVDAADLKLAGPVNVLPPTPNFPLFTIYCPCGSILYFSNPVNSKYCQMLPGKPETCDKFETTDPGKGLITGKCVDLGKMKVPILRGVGARAPYFHGGNAATLADVVSFYNKRFSANLTAEQQQDLINYLNSL